MSQRGKSSSDKRPGKGKGSSPKPKPLNNTTQPAEAKKQGAEPIKGNAWTGKIPTVTKLKAAEQGQDEVDVLLDLYLQELGLVRKLTPKDGACMFRAVSELVYNTQALHRLVRDQCVDYLASHHKDFVAFVCTNGLPYDHYLANMRRWNAWGGEVELQALSQLYRANFIIYQLHGEKGDKTYIDNGFDRSLLLCFSHGNHYDVVYPSSTMKALEACQAIVYDVVDKVLGSQPQSTTQQRPYKNLEMYWWRRALSEQQNGDHSIAQTLQGKAQVHQKNSKNTWQKKKKREVKRTKPENITPEAEALLKAVAEIEEQESKEKNFPGLPRPALPPASPLPSRESTNESMAARIQQALVEEQKRHAVQFKPSLSNGTTQQKEGKEEEFSHPNTELSAPEPNDRQPSQNKVKKNKRTRQRSSEQVIDSTQNRKDKSKQQLPSQNQPSTREPNNTPASVLGPLDVSGDSSKQATKAWGSHQVDWRNVFAQPTNAGQPQRKLQQPHPSSSESENIPLKSMGGEGTKKNRRDRKKGTSKAQGATMPNNSDPQHANLTQPSKGQWVGLFTTPPPTSSAEEESTTSKLTASSPAVPIHDQGADKEQANHRPLQSQSRSPQPQRQRRGSQQKFQKREASTEKGKSDRVSNGNTSEKHSNNGLDKASDIAEHQLLASDHTREAASNGVDGERNQNVGAKMVVAQTDVGVVFERGVLDFFEEAQHTQAGSFYFGSFDIELGTGSQDHPSPTTRSPRDLPGARVEGVSDVTQRHNVKAPTNESALLDNDAPLPLSQRFLFGSFAQEHGSNARKEETGQMQESKEPEGRDSVYMETNDGQVSTTDATVVIDGSRVAESRSQYDRQQIDNDKANGLASHDEESSDARSHALSPQHQHTNHHQPQPQSQPQHLPQHQQFLPQPELGGYYPGYHPYYHSGGYYDMVYPPSGAYIPGASYGYPPSYPYPYYPPIPPSYEEYPPSSYDEYAPYPEYTYPYHVPYIAHQQMTPPPHSPLQTSPMIPSQPQTTVSPPAPQNTPSSNNGEKF